MNEFPIGAVVSTDLGEIEITESLHGEPAFGVYRGKARNGASEPSGSFLITATIGQQLPLPTIGDRLPKSTGQLVGVFELTNGTQELAVLVEREPTGTPTTTAVPIAPQTAYELTIDLIKAVEAHNEEAGRLNTEQSIQCRAIHPDLIYIDDASRFTGLAANWRAFFNTAERPCYGYLMPFADTLSPEMALGQTDGQADDISLIAQCLFFWLTGQSAYEHDGTPIGIVQSIMMDRRCQLELPDEVQELLNQGLSPAIETRPSLSSLRTNLEKLVNNKTPEVGLGPGDIPLSEFRDLVFYATEDEADEPSPTTPSLVLQDFCSDQTKSVPMMPDVAPYLTTQTVEQTLAQIARATAKIDAQAPESAKQLKALSEAKQWLRTIGHEWISYQLEPKTLSGTGTARTVLLGT